MFTPSIVTLVVLTVIGGLLFAISVQQVALDAVQLIAADELAFRTFIPAFVRAMIAMSGGAGLLLVGLTDLALAMTGAPVRFGDGL